MLATTAFFSVSMTEMDPLDFVAFRIGGDSGGIQSDLNFPVEAHVDDIVDGYGVAAAVGDISELAVIGRVFGKVVAAATGEYTQGSPGEAEADSDGPGGVHAVSMPTWMPRGTVRCRTAAICSSSSIMAANCSG